MRIECKKEGEKEFTLDKGPARSMLMLLRLLIGERERIYVGTWYTGPDKVKYRIAEDNQSEET